MWKTSASLPRNLHSLPEDPQADTFPIDAFVATRMFGLSTAVPAQFTNSASTLRHGSQTMPDRLPSALPRVIAVALLTVCLSAHAQAATIRECQEFLRVGSYKECLDAATEAIERRSYGEEWPILKAEAEMQLGKYTTAVETVKAGVERYSWSVRLRVK